MPYHSGQAPARLQPSVNGLSNVHRGGPSLTRARRGRRGSRRRDCWVTSGRPGDISAGLASRPGLRSTGRSWR